MYLLVYVCQTSKFDLTNKGHNTTGRICEKIYASHSATEYTNAGSQSKHAKASCSTKGGLINTEKGPHSTHSLLRTGSIPPSHSYTFLTITFIQ